MLAPAPQTPVPERRGTQFKLANGMDVVVIPDHRAPVVTHMVWYRVGAADGPSHRSGLAHFLEHLMFKSTEKIADGAFPKIVMERGGQLNAFTSQDVTVYHERIAKEHLGQMMAMEADRMVNLRLTDQEVATERQVIIEERASRYDNSPNARLSEQMSAALYIAHPYRLPVIGWAHDIAQLSREDALAFYKRYYAPTNAILVVAGDVTPDEARRLAVETYGKIPANPAVEGRARPKEPPHEVVRRITLKDKRVANATFQRSYLTPSYATAESGAALALSLLMAIVGDGATGRLFRHLVVEDKVAAGASGGYFGGGFDSGIIHMQAVALPNRDLGSVEAAVDAVLDEVRQNGVSELELNRAKRSLRAAYTFESDEQEMLAERYGRALSVGRTISEIEGWPAAISQVTTDDVKAVALKHLDIRRSVTGLLLPESTRMTSSDNPTPKALGP
ncbi:MAG: pitrilysin family protein [Hyphomicrobium sp.]|jgi:zinc protease